MSKLTHVAVVMVLCRLLILAMLAGPNSQGHSQGIGGSDPGAVNGIELYVDRNPNTKIFGNENFLSSSSLCNQWMQNKSTLEKALVDASGVLNSGGRLPDGVTIVRQSANLSNNCTARATLPTGFLEISSNLP